jgi:hypothetical protein
MLIARVSFIDPSDDQPIRAGLTHVAENSDVARMFPDRFEAAGSGRSPMARSQPATHKQKLPAPLPQELDEVPGLRTEIESGFSVRLGSGAQRAIMQELERSDFVLAGGSHETGGNLYGHLRAGVLELLDASGPGSDGKARRFENSVMVSVSEGFAIGEELARQHDNALLIFSGGWHTHPIPDATPSPADRANALIGLSELERKLDWRAPRRWVDVILTPDAVRGWDAPYATAWATRRLGQFGSVTERVRVESD